MPSPDQSESGEILLDVRTTKSLRDALCDWTNMVHSAVMFEIRTLVGDAPSTAAGRERVEASLTPAVAHWAQDTGPVQRRLINRLAHSALAAHLAECRAGSQKFRAPPLRILDDLLPKRSTRDDYFAVPDEQGCVPAGLTLDRDSITWHAEARDGRPASAARQAPLAVVAFTFLDRIKFKPGWGGDIVTTDGVVVLSYP